MRERVKGDPIQIEIGGTHQNAPPLTMWSHCIFDYIHFSSFRFSLVRIFYLLILCQIWCFLQLFPSFYSVFILTLSSILHMHYAALQRVLVWMAPDSHFQKVCHHSKLPSFACISALYCLLVPNNATILSYYSCHISAIRLGQCSAMLASKCEIAIGVGSETIVLQTHKLAPENDG